MMLLRCYNVDEFKWIETKLESTPAYIAATPDRRINHALATPTRK